MPLNVAQKADIDALREDTQPTRRACVPELEEILYEAIPVLDHGFVRLVDYMGDDSAIVQAARVSYGKGTKKLSQDKGLIKYLMRHWHTTPFEMCEIKFHIKMPIFVARQWIRHRTANVNEYSGRYSVMEDQFYIPKPENLAAQSEINNQGRGEILADGDAKKVIDLLEQEAKRSYQTYSHLMNEREDGTVIDEDRTGIARELARMNLTLNCYTQWYWKIDLHNLMHFLMLRADSHSQYEIRVFADVILDIMKKWVPFTHEAYEQYREGAAHISKNGLEVVKRMLAGEKVEQEDSGLSPREWRELQDTLS